jgi:spore maturation protein CgeB
MKFLLFYHSLLSDWNHGNAHFLRGMVSELLARRHSVTVYEPRDSWSFRNLLREGGAEAIQRFRSAYPNLDSVRYDLSSLDWEQALSGADVVLVHEWNDPRLVHRLGQLRERKKFRLYFHDTHHRAFSDASGLRALALEHCDGVLAYGRVLREWYAATERARRAWVWHEAADARVFKPLPTSSPEGDLVWIGNWGDDERSQELREFLIEPVRALGLRATVYGVRYPDEARRALAEAGIEYRGWLPNFDVPRVFSRYRVTVHIPRRPYVKALPGIPTIRVFEALACGIPLVCSPWDDVERLFRPGFDYLLARTGKEMRRQLASLLDDSARAKTLAAHGLETIRARHTCAHRADELLEIVSRTPVEESKPAA